MIDGNLFTSISMPPPLPYLSRNAILRQPEASEIPDLLELFAAEVQAGLMLPRRPGDILAHLENWLILEEQGQLRGCVSLVFFNPSLCELRSLAVHPDFRGGGRGKRLVIAALELARQRGAGRVLTLTRAVPFFLELGFRYNQVSNFPEKVWRDCRPCPLRHICDETALIYGISPAGLAQKEA
ncbi:MAG: GNAT family N-acetyltransferase [Anaerolineales bacterium]